jgi:hypothetical protein
VKQEISISVLVNKQISSCHIVLNKTFVFWPTHKGLQAVDVKNITSLKLFGLRTKIFDVWDKNHNIF